MFCFAAVVLIFSQQRLRPPRTQVVRYMKGEFYAEHYDNKAGGHITRAATIIIYLDTTPAGGGTFFPRCPGPPALDQLLQGSLKPGNAISSYIPLCAIF